MDERMMVVRGAFVLAVTFFFNLTAVTQEPPAYEKIPVKLNAALIVLDGKLEGKGYTIDPVALNDGYANTYALKTEVGEVKAVSDYRLARRIQEIRALIILDEMSRSGVFGDAMKEGIMALIRGGKQLVTAPVETTKGAVKGVGGWTVKERVGLLTGEPLQNQTAAGAGAGATGNVIKKVAP